MDSAQIAALLQPFLASRGEDYSSQASLGESAALTETQLRQFSTYLDLLLRWNSRINLTSVREPELMVTRHFGESLFAARQLLPAQLSQEPDIGLRLFDFGSGAGFPGLPIKVWAPYLELTLIESNQKKATFLREVVRALGLNSVKVFSGRAEDFHEEADIVTVRAVEKFERSVLVAAGLASSGGRLALLIGESQVADAKARAAGFEWRPAIPIPLSTKRVVLIGVKEPS
jgi:16S rRNA (guanine527-N7)-methyltransferase